MRNVMAGLLVSFLVTCSAAAQVRDSEVPLLVSTPWLAEHLQDPAVVILWTGHGQPDVAQIPGTHLVPHGSLMTMQSGQYDLATARDLVAMLEGAGVSNGSHVVVYGEPMAAGWLFFALDYLGHARLSMLDGGTEKWRAEGRPTAGPAPVSTHGVFKPSIRSGLKVTAEDVQARIAKGGVALLDARTTQEYDDGRLPGARLIPWPDLYADQKLGVFKTRDALVALFQAAGAAPGTPAITYCQIGLRSSLLYFAARYAGLDVNNYIGSWSDWNARTLPAERGNRR
jgi:thiosulfate/3-mercaptopyruvate sulfurtransferase